MNGMGIGKERKNGNKNNNDNSVFLDVFLFFVLGLQGSFLLRRSFPGDVLLSFSVQVLQREGGEEQPQEVLEALKWVDAPGAKNVPHLQGCQETPAQQHDVGVACHWVDVVVGQQEPQDERRLGGPVKIIKKKKKTKTRKKERREKKSSI